MSSCTKMLIFSHSLCCFAVYIHMPYCFVVSFLIHMLHCCFSSYTWYVLLFLFHMLWLAESVKEWYIYIVVFIICCAIILPCSIVWITGWILPMVFSYPFGCGYGLKSVPRCGCGCGYRVRFQDMGAGLVRIHPHPVATGVIGIPNVL